MSVNIPFTKILREERGETFHLKDMPLIRNKFCKHVYFTDDKSKIE